MVKKFRMNKNILPFDSRATNGLTAVIKCEPQHVWEEVQDLTSSFNSVLSSRTNNWTLMWFYRSNRARQTGGVHGWNTSRRSTSDWNQPTCKWSTSIWKAGAERTVAGNTSFKWGGLKPPGRKTENTFYTFIFHLQTLKHFLVQLIMSGTNKSIQKCKRSFWVGDVVWRAAWENNLTVFHVCGHISVFMTQKTH